MAAAVTIRLDEEAAAGSNSRWKEERALCERVESTASAGAEQLEATRQLLEREKSSTRGALVMRSMEIAQVRQELELERVARANSEVAAASILCELREARAALQYGPANSVAEEAKQILHEARELENSACEIRNRDSVKNEELVSRAQEDARAASAAFRTELSASKQQQHIIQCAVVTLQEELQRVQDRCEDAEQRRLRSDRHLGVLEDKAQQLQSEYSDQCLSLEGGRSRERELQVEVKHAEQAAVLAKSEMQSSRTLCETLRAREAVLLHRVEAAEADGIVRSANAVLHTRVDELELEVREMTASMRTAEQRASDAACGLLEIQKRLEHKESELFDSGVRVREMTLEMTEIRRKLEAATSSKQQLLELCSAIQPVLGRLPLLAEACRRIGAEELDELDLSEPLPPYDWEDAAKKFARARHCFEKATQDVEVVDAVSSLVVALGDSVLGGIQDVARWRREFSRVSRSFEQASKLSDESRRSCKRMHRKAEEALAKHRDEVRHLRDMNVMLRCELQSSSLGGGGLATGAVSAGSPSAYEKRLGRRGKSEGRREVGTVFRGQQDTLGLSLVA